MQNELYRVNASPEDDLEEDPLVEICVTEERNIFVVWKIVHGEGGKMVKWFRDYERNLAIEHFRKNTRARERQGEENESRTIAAPDPSQLDHLLKEERATLVHHVLAALPSERDRKVLRRFYIADDDKEEICADLGISSLHFNQILCRARERYRKAFDELSRAGGK